MHPQIEDLRKKAFLVYGDLMGPELVNKEVRKLGINENKVNQVQLKIVLNRIIKNVFIDKIGLDATKQVLAMEVSHVPGYHRIPEEKGGKISIISRIKFMKWFVAFVVVLIAGIMIGGGYYTMTFNTVELCDKKKDPVERDRCYITIALNDLNVSLCDKMSTHTKKYNCYSQMGMKLNSTEICRQIPPDNTDLIAAHDKCITCVAFKMNNVTLCRSFISPVKQSECENQLMRGYSLVC